VLDAIGDGLNDLADMLAQPSTAALDARSHLRLAEVADLAIDWRPRQDSNLRHRLRRVIRFVQAVLPVHRDASE
jgi:hypothetical protein